jgi:hypothetical protein
MRARPQSVGAGSMERNAIEGGGAGTERQKVTRSTVQAMRHY